MRILTRILIFFALIFAAIASYSYGVQSGFFAFIVLGFAFEAAFWLGLFPKKKKQL